MWAAVVRNQSQINRRKDCFAGEVKGLPIRVWDENFAKCVVKASLPKWSTNTLNTHLLVCSRAFNAFTKLGGVSDWTNINTVSCQPFGWRPIRKSCFMSLQWAHIVPARYRICPLPFALPHAAKIRCSNIVTIDRMFAKRKALPIF